MSKFQTILTGIFIFFILAGVAAFATFQSSSTQNELPAIEIWGTMPDDTFIAFVQSLNVDRDDQLRVAYVEKREEDFYNDYIETLARGGGPDAILIPHDMLRKLEDILVTIPYETLPQRNFQGTFIPQADLYLRDNGVLAVPFSIDPLVMYWNKDTFTNAGLAREPRFWDEFPSLSLLLTQKDVNANVRRSAVALGEFRNVTNAREIFGTLLMQTGNPVTAYSQGYLMSTLGTTANGYLDGAEEALNFFTRFSNPADKEAYSWNRSLPESKNFFISGTLATYFGFASEIKDIREKNPNLNFDITAIPQIRQGTNRITYSTLYGLSIAKSSLNPSGTYAIITLLASAEANAKLSSLLYLPSVHRSTIARGTTDSYMTIFNDASLISRAWIDPSKTGSATIFQNIVESKVSGRSSTQQALRDGSDAYDLLINPRE